MRQITKTINLPVEGKTLDFRLTKLDAFSGVSLLRMLDRCKGVILSDVVCGARDGGPVRGARAIPCEGSFSLSLLSDTDLHTLMTACLQHCEVLLPAGWIPVMTRGEWTYPELEHDTAVCLKLTLEEACWTLEGFFAGGGSASPTATPAT